MSFNPLRLLTRNVSTQFTLSAYCTGAATACETNALEVQIDACPPGLPALRSTTDDFVSCQACARQTFSIAPGATSCSSCPDELSCESGVIDVRAPGWFVVATSARDRVGAHTHEEQLTAYQCPLGYCPLTHVWRMTPDTSAGTLAAVVTGGGTGVLLDSTQASAIDNQIVPGHSSAPTFPPSSLFSVNSPSTSINLPLLSPCASGRTGALCGACLPSHSQSLSSAECVPDSQCTDASWVVPLLLLLCLLYLLYFLLSSPASNGVVGMLIFYYQLVGIASVDTSVFMPLTSLFELRVCEFIQCMHTARGICFVLVSNILWHNLTPSSLYQLAGH